MTTKWEYVSRTVYYEKGETDALESLKMANIMGRSGWQWVHSSGGLAGEGRYYSEMFFKREIDPQRQVT